jgi:hypothetical protein
MIYWSATDNHIHERVKNKDIFHSNTSKMGDNHITYSDVLDEDSTAIVNNGRQPRIEKRRFVDDSDQIDIVQSPDSPLDLRLDDESDGSEQEAGLDMMDVCRGLRIEYASMQKFIDRYDDQKLNRAVIDLFEDVKGLDKTDQKKLDKCAKLCALSVYKRLKFMEKRCADYQKRSDDFNIKTRTYRHPKVRRPTKPGPPGPDTEFKDVDLAAEANSLLTRIDDPEQKMTRELDMRMTGLLGSMLTPYGKKIELIKYKLLYYIPEKQIRVRRATLPTATVELKAELDGVSDILSPYMEDTKWKINTERSLNFKVPDSKLVFSNTVNEDDTESDYLDTYLNMIIRYLERITDSKSVKYYIVEDNKYDIHWVLIALSIGKDKS